MYAQFFGLAHEPFSIAPDPRYLFMSERHREALAHLLYGVGGGGGFVLLSGEIGTGKTTVCRCFLEQIPGNCNVAYIFNPKLTAEELLRSVCDEFHVDCTPRQPGTAPTAKDLVDALNGFLLREHAAGRNNVLIIDEAQNLSADVLEQLRLLTNLETSERKLLQIMLIGQPELRTMLARPELEQLAQRVVARFHLDALSEAETQQYIQHRLAVAGLKGAIPFDRKAVRRIHALTGGVPRRINLLCDRALLGAYATGQATVNAQIVDKAATEVFESRVPVKDRGIAGRLGLLALGVAAGLLVAGTAAWLWRSGDARSASGGSERTGTQGPGNTARAGAAPAGTLAAPPVTAAASGAGTPAAPDLRGSWAQLPRTEDEALRELARLWNLQPAEGDPCEAAARNQILCFRQNGSLVTLRQLDRPVVLALRDEAGQEAFALLTGIGPQTATLRGGSGSFSVPLSALAGMWQGSYRTFWRAPPGYGLKRGDTAGPVVDWLAARLATAQGQPPPQGRQFLDAALRAKLQAFQLAQGLAPDGRPGPLTLMLLNRATGVDEPRLSTDR
jgi:general secretion pathway protein A